MCDGPPRAGVAGVSASFSRFQREGNPLYPVDRAMSLSRVEKIASNAGACDPQERKLLRPRSHLGFLEALACQRLSSES